MEWHHILWSALGIVVTGLASWAIHRLVTFLNGKIKDAEAKRFLSEAGEIITSAVKSTYQTYVENLKNMDAFDEEAQKTALKTAAEAAQNKMSEDVKKFIAENYGELSEWITEQIETVLYDLKNPQKADTESKN